jgi:ribosomal protein L37AE/L43A
MACPPPEEPGPHRPSPYYDNAGARASEKGGIENQLAQARCPRCDRPMVARLGRQGPYWQCGCPRKS